MRWLFCSGNGGLSSSLTDSIGREAYGKIKKEHWWPITIEITDEAANWFFSNTITCFKESVKENNPVDKGEQRLYSII